MFVVPVLTADHHGPTAREPIRYNKVFRGSKASPLELAAAGSGGKMRSTKLREIDALKQNLAPILARMDAASEGQLDDIGISTFHETLDDLLESSRIGIREIDQIGKLIEAAYRAASLGRPSAAES
jgi:hypothetical protein